ncbi:MAG: hypothetical protein WBX38_07215 [Candidatus Sulfotelmatobacter sp.]
MSEVLFIGAFLGLIVGLAALILFLLDKFTLRPGTSAEERKAAIDARTGRWQRVYGGFFFVMAVIAMVVNAFNLSHESIR